MHQKEMNQTEQTPVTTLDLVVLGWGLHHTNRELQRDDKGLVSTSSLCVTNEPGVFHVRLSESGWFFPEQNVQPMHKLAQPGGVLPRPQAPTFTTADGSSACAHQWHIQQSSD